MYVLVLNLYKKYIGKSYPAEVWSNFDSCLGDADYYPHHISTIWAGACYAYSQKGLSGSKIGFDMYI